MRHLELASIALPIVVVLLVFGPAGDNGFWRDDFTLLARARTAVSYSEILVSQWMPPFNRPLAQLAFYLEYRRWGLRSGRYILTNMALHVLDAVLLFALLRGPLGEAAALFAALLFAAGLGFYGKALFWAANLSELLVTALLLGMGIAAQRFLRAPTAAAAWRAAAVLLVLFGLALGSKESAVMAPVLVGGLWFLQPDRRTAHRLLRLVTPMAGMLAVYSVLQIAQGSCIASLTPRMWLALPARGLRLATLMGLPILEKSALVASIPGLPAIASLVDAVRPALALLCGVLLALGVARASGPVRWLLVGYLAFLLPYGMIEQPGARLDLRYAYLPATCFCGLVAHGCGRLWRAGTFGPRVAATVALSVWLAGTLVVVRVLERQWDAMGKSVESQEKMRCLVGSQQRGQVIGWKHP